MKRQQFIPNANQCTPVERAHSTLSVSAVDYYLNLPNPPSPALSTVTLTPGRIRNIDQDMEALRASRQDNPFIQQVIASKESLIDSLEEESDHVNLMAKETMLDLDIDPLTLPEMHEHMIRSPPPTNWPKSPNFRIFQFPTEVDDMLQVEINTKNKNKVDSVKPKHSSWNGSTADTSPIKIKSHHQDRFSLLTPTSLRNTDDDNIHLMSED